jgi:hypothetical protein
MVVVLDTSHEEASWSIGPPTLAIDQKMLNKLYCVEFLALRGAVLSIRIKNSCKKSDSVPHYGLIYIPKEKGVEN